MYDSRFPNVFVDNEILEVSYLEDRVVVTWNNGASTECRYGEGVTLNKNLDKRSLLSNCILQKLYDEDYLNAVLDAFAPKDVNQVNIVDLIDTEFDRQSEACQKKFEKEQIERKKREIEKAYHEKLKLIEYERHQQLRDATTIDVHTDIEYSDTMDSHDHCLACAQTAVKSSDDVYNLLTSIRKNFKIYFNVQFKNLIKINVCGGYKYDKDCGNAMVKLNPDDTLGFTKKLQLLGKTTYTICVKKDIPMISAISAIVHELTHIWQDENKLEKRDNIQVSEGMAFWAEVQYLYLIGEAKCAKRQAALLSGRNDDFGTGYNNYAKQYPHQERYSNFLKHPFE